MAYLLTIAFLDAIKTLGRIKQVGDLRWGGGYGEIRQREPSGQVAGIFRNVADILDAME